MTDGQPPAGWYPDPLGRYDHRWFNGRTWTADVSVDGRRFVDPQGVGVGPVPPSGRGATAAMTCGIVGVAIAWIPLVVVIGTALGIAAVALGIGSARANSGQRRRAIAGVVLGVVALAVSIVGWVFTVDLYREVVGFVETGPRLVENTTCTVADRNATVAGTITNLDDEPHRYTLFVTVTTSVPGAGSGRDGVTRYAEIDEVAPGDTTSWQIRIDGVDVTEGTCEAEIVVNGPFPWGIETDPYQE